GPTYLTTVSSSLQLWQGSNLTGGASGGPWVVNFGAEYPAFAGGAGTGDATGLWVVGATSWGSSDPNTPKDKYSSRFGQNTRDPNADDGGRGAGNIGALMNALCSVVGSGGQTYAQLGYCN